MALFIASFFFSINSQSFVIYPLAQSVLCLLFACWVPLILCSSQILPRFVGGHLAILFCWRGLVLLPFLLTLSMLACTLA